MGRRGTGVMATSAMALVAVVLAAGVWVGHAHGRRDVTIDVDCGGGSVVVRDAIRRGGGRATVAMGAKGSLVLAVALHVQMAGGQLLLPCGTYAGWVASRWHRPRVDCSTP